MGLTRILEPDGEPITLELAKLHIKQDLDVEDDLLAGLIQAARELAESYTQSAFMTQTWRLTLDHDWPRDHATSCGPLWPGDGCPRILLPRPPLQAVSSVKYIDLAGTQQTLDPAKYIVSKRDTGLWAIEPAYAVIWPTVQCIPSAITVEFIAGVAGKDVPQAIKSALLVAIGYMSSNRGDANDSEALPLQARSLLQPYRVYPGIA
jgi:uncharacterized phiE125 gp8 family phage protein